MKRFTLAISVLALIGALMSGTVQAKLVHEPDSFGTIDDAYSFGDMPSLPDGVPSEAIRKVMLPVGYEDAFRAAMVAAVQSMLFVEATDNERGLILATRTLTTTPNWIGEFQQESKLSFYYALIVREVGPESTEIIAVAKSQGECIWQKIFGRTPGGCKAVFQKCKDYSTLDWAVGKTQQGQELEQLMGFIRNELLAAGLF